MNRKRPIAIDLFAGVGGMTLGFEQAGFDILGSVEIDPIHCAVHEYNFPFWTTICSDISKINAKTIKSLSQIRNQDIDVVFGGPPCQGFSSMGKRDPKDNRNNLIEHFIRLVIELQPKYFVIENVPGMATKNNQAFLKKIFNKFTINNYQIQTKYKILNSANYGVPQIRKRLFLLGAKSNSKASSHLFAQIHHLSPSFKPKKSNSGLGVIKSLPICLENIRNLFVSSAQTVCSPASFSKKLQYPSL